MRLFGLLVLLSIASPARAEEVGRGADLGLGASLGQPSGVTFGTFLSPELAVHGLVGGWLHPHQGLVLGVDLVYHVRDLVPSVKPIELGAFFGGGVGAGGWTSEQYHRHDEPWPHWHTHAITEALLYLRPIVGGALWFRTLPLEVQLEIAPSLRLLPGSAGFEWGGGVAVRYYF